MEFPDWAGSRVANAEPTHIVSRPITRGFWTSDRRQSLDAGTLLHRIEVVQYLEWTCAGPFLSSVGRYEVLGAGSRVVAEITHATIHDDVGPVIEGHPDLAVASERITRPS